MLSSAQILELLQNCPEGYLKPDHALFLETNSNLLQTYRKLGAISNKDSSISASGSQDKIFCNVFGCSAVFDNVASYQSHYNAVHRFICAECKKSFPTDHLLDLHISENHDSYFMARLERGDRLFKCFLEECSEVFGNSSERKDHCMKQHKFPSNFRFDQFVQKTCKKKKDTSRKKADEYQMEVDNELKSANSDKSQPPKIISFGHQKEKTFCKSSSLSKKQDAGTTLDMNIFKDVLDTI